MATTNLAFLDTETTGLDPDQHEIWEVGLIVDDEEYLWQLPVDLGHADSRALDIGHYFERRWRDLPDAGETVRLAMEADILSGNGAMEHLVPAYRLDDWARRFADLTRGRHLVGAVISFDEERLRKLLRVNGACPGWHYHLIDVEGLAVGWLNGRGRNADGESWLPELPWDSDDLSMAVGVKPPGGGERHTALGDARWVKAIYEACAA